MLHRRVASLSHVATLRCPAMVSTFFFGFISTSICYYMCPASCCCSYFTQLERNSKGETR